MLLWPAHMRLNTQLGIWFMVLALLPLSVGGVIYWLAKQAVQKEVINSLTVIADARADFVENYLLVQKKSASILASSRRIADALAFYAQGQARDVVAENDLQTLLAFYAEQAGFYDLLLILPSGDVVFSVLQEDDLGVNVKTGSLQGSVLGQAFAQAVLSQTCVISPFEYYGISKRFAMFVALPVFDLKRTRMLGVLALQLDQDNIFKLESDYTGLGESGEMLFGQLKDGKVWFITPVRFGPDAAFKWWVSIGSPEALPLQAAALGRQGQGFSVDYRGQPVLAVWRYLTTSGWGMVVKIDQSEAFAPVQRLRNLMLIFGGLIFFVAIGAALWAARSVSNSMETLSQAVAQVRAGNFSTQVAEKGSKEVVMVAGAFNAMARELNESYGLLKEKNRELENEVEERRKVAAQLQHHKDHLEDLVDVRTRALEKTNVELMRRNKELDDFAYIASHDLKAPLRGIDNLSKWIEEDLGENLPAESKRHLSLMQQRVKRLERLLDDVLHYSRAGRYNYATEQVDVGVLLSEVIEMVKPPATFDIQVKGEMPMLVTPRTPLLQVFQNLIDNAIKFHNRKDGHVEIGGVKEGNYYRFYVSDDGPGIAPMFHEKVFQLFQKLQTNKEVDSTGIGLAVVKKIVESQGGKIVLISDEGQGVRFEFTWPIDSKGLSKN